jgi:hypothetical protein
VTRRNTDYKKINGDMSAVVRFLRQEETDVVGVRRR